MRFSQLPRPSFSGRKADPDEKVPAPFRGKALRRRHVMVKEARELLPHLPTDPGQSTHCLLTGRTDLMVVLVEMLAHYGGTCQYLRLATLSFNSRNTVEMASLLKAGRVASLTLLCSHFFRCHNSDEYTEAKRHAGEYPGRWRIAAARNHAKVVCADLGSRKLVCESSANLRCNANVEQLSVTLDGGLHDWHSSWIDEMVSRHEHDAENEDAGE